jgi:hypothetical protein
MDFQLRQVKRFREIIVGTLLHGLDRRLNAAMRREQKRFELWLLLFQLREQLDAAFAWQMEIEESHVAADVLGFRKCLLGVGGGGDFHPLALEAARQRLPELVIIVNYEQTDGRRAWVRHDRLSYFKTEGGRASF